MDPFLALSIACATLQFIDFGVEIITTAHEVYKSKSGMSARHIELQEKSKRLTTITSTISIPTSTINVEVEAGLKKIIIECNEVETQFHALLEDLKLVSSTSSDKKLIGQAVKVFKSVVKSSKALAKTSKITELTERMDGLRTEVHSHILYMLNEQASKTYQNLDNLVQRNTEMGTKLSFELEKARLEIIHQLRHQPSSNSAASTTETIESLMGRLSKTASDVNLKTKILSSLDFIERRDRFNHITSATDNTFKWISTSSISHSSGKTVHFTEWLRSKEADDNYFWISGKPGSGKSTLMKYLSTDDKVIRHLKEWARPKKLLTCQFYFWISGGSQMLRDKLGFLRALAFDILKSDPDAIPHACSRIWNKYSTIKPILITWNTEELLETIERAMNWDENNTKYCFFIDGLDEYSGRPDQIIDLLLKLPKSFNTKYCISSRKWNDFQETFDKDMNSKRALYLEELNTADIRTFVSTELEGEVIFRDWTQLNEQESEYLVDTVVTKSAGVFLWVDLVVRSLIRGIRNEDTLEILQDRLTGLPEELPDYFERMLDNVEDVYRPDAAKIYHVMLRTTQKPYLIMFAFMEEKNPEFGTLAKIEPFSDTEVEDLRRKTRLRINARCTDLLDIIEAPRTDIYFQNKVDFLHRTVREFMEERKTKSRLKEWLLKDKRGGTFDPAQYICQSIVAQIKRAPTRRQYLSAGEGPITELATHFRSFEIDIMASGSQCIRDDLKKEFVRAIKEHGRNDPHVPVEAYSSEIYDNESVYGREIPMVIVQDCS